MKGWRWPSEMLQAMLRTTPWILDVLQDAQTCAQNQSKDMYILYYITMYCTPVPKI